MRESIGSGKIPELPHPYMPPHISIPFHPGGSEYFAVRPTYSHTLSPHFIFYSFFLLLYETQYCSIQYNIICLRMVWCKYYKFCHLCQLSLFIHSFIILLKFTNHIDYYAIKISIDSNFNIFSSLLCTFRLRLEGVNRIE